MPNPPLILASTSVYRKALLERLRIPFICVTPAVDETPLAGETALETAARLAHAKAQAVAAQYLGALIIGSDQVALLAGQQLGKPLTHARATEQLKSMRGETVVFHTALCLFDARNHSHQACVESIPVTMRNYSDATIEAYLQKEQPYDCAGSAKSEGLGIALIEKIDNNDPSALIGLPLIQLITMLEKAGFNLWQ